MCCNFTWPEVCDLWSVLVKNVIYGVRPPFDAVFSSTHLGRLSIVCWVLDVDIYFHSDTCNKNFRKWYWTGGPGCHSVFKIIPVVFRTGLCARQSSSSMKSFQYELLFLPIMLEENTYTPLYLKWWHTPLCMLDFMHLFTMDIAEMIKPVDFKGAFMYMELVWII